MKKISLIGCAVSLLCISSLHAQTMRCGNNLVSVGDRGFEIIRKCGQPVYQDTVGYTLGPGPSQRTELRIDEWVYGPKNGMLYILRIKGNRLVAIETKRIP